MYDSFESSFIELKLDLAEGVPIPKDILIPRKNLIYRELYICLINTNTYEFFGNTVRVRGLWDPSCEDRWVFSG